MTKKTDGDMCVEFICPHCNELCKALGGEYYSGQTILAHCYSCDKQVEVLVN